MRAKSRARRSLFTSSGTSSFISLSAGVPGRGENLKPKSEVKPTSSTRLKVCAKSSSVSPGKPMMMSVDMVIPGRAARSRRARSTYSARV